MTINIFTKCVSAWFIVLLPLSTAIAKDANEADETPSYRLEVTILAGYSIKANVFNDSQNWQSESRWGPAAGLRLGVTHDQYPVYGGVMVTGHLGKRCGIEDESVTGVTAQLGAEVGFEHHYGPFILRPSVVFGAIWQNATTEDSSYDDLGFAKFDTTDAYFSPGITEIWNDVFAIGFDLRSIFGLGKHIQPGYAFALLLGGRFSIWRETR